MLLRNICIYLLKRFGQYDQLWERAIETEVGPMGFILPVHKKEAVQKGIVPLNSFDRWLLKPMIKERQRYLRDSLNIEQELFPLE